MPFGGTGKTMSAPTENELSRRSGDDRRTQGARRRRRRFDPRYLTILRSILMGAVTASAEANSAFTLATLSGRLVEVLKEIGKITGEIERLNPSSITTISRSCPIRG